MRNLCENCHKTFTHESDDAYICSYECTFCKDCVENKLNRTCPNCGGEFQKRPKRKT
ncbi:MAG: DUF1272 domain-containing protein [Candidatus Arcticimaribacter sp.]